MMSVDEMLMVLQAHKEGKKIERLGRYDIWEVVDDPTFNFGLACFRVAPEPRKPREWSVAISPDGRILHGVERGQIIDVRFPNSLARVREEIE